MIEPRDFDTQTWQRLRALLTARLQQLREENDSGDAEITAKRRGRIAELKELLALEKPQARRQQPTDREQRPVDVTHIF